MWSLVVFVADLSGLYHGLCVTAVRLADIGCLQFYNLLAAFTYSVALFICLVFWGLPINLWCPSTLQKSWVLCAWISVWIPLRSLALVFWGLPINLRCPSTFSKSWVPLLQLNLPLDFHTHSIALLAW